MSSRKILFTENRPTVLVKSFKNRPAKLWAVAKSDDYVEVQSEDGEASIRVRASEVYEFGESVFRKLMSAFTRGDHDALSTLWNQSPIFTS